MKAKQYTVLKDHSGFKKGSIRKCHPNLAAMLAKSGKLSPDPVDLKKEKCSPTKTKEEEKPKADVISTASKETIPQEVLDAIEKTEKEEKAKPKKGKAK